MASARAPTIRIVRRSTRAIDTPFGSPGRLGADTPRAEHPPTVSPGTNRRKRVDSALSTAVRVSARRHNSGVVAQSPVGLTTRLRSRRTVDSRQARSAGTSLPWTSVSRKSRPWNLYVSFSWSMPSRCSIVACRSCTSTGSLDDVVAEVVGLADGHARLDAAAGQPHRERARMVVAAQEVRAVARLVHRRAPELAAPDDQRVVEQAALLQVGEQRVDRLVGLLAQARQLLDDVLAERGAVRVPAAVIELHEAHAALDQPPRQQAVVGERRLARLGAVQLVDAGRLVARCRSARARSSACGRPARRRRCASAISGSPVSAACSRFRSLIAVELRRRAVGVDAVRVGDEQHRIACPSGTRRPGARSAGSRCPSSSCRRRGCSRRTAARRSAGRSALSLPRP